MLSMCFFQASEFKYGYKLYAYIKNECIIKELEKKFEGQFEYLGENAEKYKTFSIPIEKEVRIIDRDSKESAVTIS